MDNETILSNRYQAVEIIAECGVNHNGSLKLALELVRAAAGAGADVVKFQSFRANKLATSDAPRSPYQDRNTLNSDSQLEMLSSLELSENDHRSIARECKKLDVEFMSSPFDEISAKFLVTDLQVKRIKLGSGEITNAALLVQCARLRRPIVMSTGMSTLGEVGEALSVLAFGYTASKKSQPNSNAFRHAFMGAPGQKALKSNVALLHCTTDYPSQFDEVNLAAMDTLANAYGLPVGISDHTPGISIPLAGVARGASIVEKHFTMDKNLPGPDHKASLEPNEFAQMVNGIREVEVSLGNGIKLPAIGEMNNIHIVRKSIVCLQPIKVGDVFSIDNITVKRPGTGVSAMLYWDFLGRVATRKYNVDELIQP